MTASPILPSLTNIPENIDKHLRQLLQQPPDPATGNWLYELIRASGHMSTPDHLRWRVVCMVWLAAEYNIDQAWPYLMWLNQNQPVISEHLADILSEGANDLDAHVRLVNWVATAREQRLQTFFSNFRHIPARYTMPDLIRGLLAKPTAPETGVWLATYCRDTAQNAIVPLRPWRLLTAAWYATCFDPTAGLTYLRELSQGESTLDTVDNQILTDLANELNCLASLTQWVANCSDPAVRTMLKDIGHPDLATFAAVIFQRPPDYQHLTGLTHRAEADAHLFKRVVSLLEQSGASLKTVTILDLACGPLASQTLLLNSVGAKVTGADLHIPPAYLPLPGFKQWFQRGKYVKAWQEATSRYYQLLAQHSGLKLKWNGVKIVLADLTRLDFAAGTFEVVVCLNHLQHAPDVAAVLAEAARVLKPGGVLVANVVPFASYNGAFSADDRQPWHHLRQPEESAYTPGLVLNQWRENQYRAVFEKFFQIEQWQTEQNERAQAQLTPALKAELTAYDEAELTRQQIMVVARKSG